MPRLDYAHISKGIPLVRYPSSRGVFGDHYKWAMPRLQQFLRYFRFQASRGSGLLERSIFEIPDVPP